MNEHDSNKTYRNISINHSLNRYILDVDLALTLGFNLIILTFVFSPLLNGTVARPILSIILILFIPGYSLVAALFPGKDDIGAIERIALSFGLNLAIIPLIGLFLNFTPFGIRLEPIATLITLFIIICVLMANWRRHKLPAVERFSPDMVSILLDVRKSLFTPDENHLNNTLSIITILIILVIILMSAYFLLIPVPGESYTEFYILGTDGKIGNYPVDFSLGDNKSILVNVANHERRTVNYDLVISLNDSTRPIYTDQFTLADNQTWNKSVVLKPDLSGTNLKLMFLLYADRNMNAPYRECHLYVNVTSNNTIAGPARPGL